MPVITIIGTTSWGITLAVVLARGGREVRLWARTEEEAAELRRSAPSMKLLPGTRFPDHITVTSSLAEAADHCDAVILAVPSQTMRQNISLAAPELRPGMLIISAAKGMEISSHKRMSQVIADEVPSTLHESICVLSGPNLSQEILRDLPAATVLAAENEVTARQGRKLISLPKFCVYINHDVIGVELGGALKNIIALGAGMIDGLGYGDNLKAAFVTRGLTEITALGQAMGANPLTFAGLAGLGDLIATCASPLSRNHYVGAELAKGRRLADITRSMTNVAEGVSTTVVACNLSQKLGVEMPLTEKIYQVLYQGQSPNEVIKELLSEEPRHELHGRRWKLRALFDPRRR
jgi:glycerol-3-phosphate dehydrogenase (NAD(P)+)